MERWSGSFVRGFAVVLATIGFASSASAATVAIPGLFNTGVDNSKNVLPDGTTPDPHYSLISVPAGSGTTTSVVRAAGGFPVGPWIGDSTISAWITPAGERTDAIPLGGDYTFRTTFNLTGLIPGTAQITGRWSTDNQGIRILINGVEATQAALPSGFTTYTTFSILSGFQSGVNTLDFVVRNLNQVSGNPVGLRVEMTGAASPVPLPAAAWLLLSGIAGLGLVARRRSV